MRKFHDEEVTIQFRDGTVYTGKAVSDGQHVSLPDGRLIYKSHVAGIEPARSGKEVKSHGIG